MFAGKAKSVVHYLGAERDLIYNENLSEPIEFLSLVKVQKRKSWPIVKYSFLDLTLYDIMSQDVSDKIQHLQDIYKEGPLLENITSSLEFSGSASCKTAVAEPAGFIEGAAEGSGQRSASPFNLTYKMINLRQLRKNCKDIEVDLSLLGNLESKTKLAFVHKIVTNSNSVTLTNKAAISGSLSGEQKYVAKVSAKGKIKGEMSYTLPKDTLFAFGLMQIDIIGKKLTIPLVKMSIKRDDYGPKHLLRERFFKMIPERDEDEQEED